MRRKTRIPHLLQETRGLFVALGCLRSGQCRSSDPRRNINRFEEELWRALACQSVAMVVLSNSRSQSD
jgi:hypothetical protein